MRRVDSKTLVRAALRRLARHHRLMGVVRTLSLGGLVPRTLWQRLPVERTYRVHVEDSSFRYEPVAYDTAVRSLFWRGIEGFGDDGLPIWAQLARHASCAVDVGASTGVFTLTALAANPAVHVTSIEAAPDTYTRLCRQVSLNGWSGRTRLVQAAASDTSGDASFYVTDRPLAPSARLTRAAYRHALGQEIVTVPTWRLDDLIHRADLVKIDVEGAEHLVLGGMQRLLAECRPTLFIEVLPGGPAQEVATCLAAFDYRYFRATRQGLRPCPHLEPDPSRRQRNYVCLPAARLPEVDWLLRPDSRRPAVRRRGRREPGCV